MLSKTICCCCRAKPPDVWYPTQSVNAHAYADQIAEMLGMEIVAPFETYSQAFAFGASPEMLVGPFSEALDLSQRYTWADLGNAERYGYLLSTQGRHEALSFHRRRTRGHLGWPTITPLDPAASSTFSTGSNFALQMSLPADDGPAGSPDRLKFPGYSRALDLLGAAGDESQGSSCGSARETDAGTSALVDRIEGFRVRLHSTGHTGTGANSWRRRRMAGVPASGVALSTWQPACAVHRHRRRSRRCANLVAG